jgi:hypothetical protein
MATHLIPLEVVGKGKREMPKEFLAPDGNYISDALVSYSLPLIGGKEALRKIGRLEPIFYNVELESEPIRA